MESDQELPVSILLLPDVMPPADEPIDASVPWEEGRFNSVRPSLVSTDGDTRINIIGTLFADGVTVRIANRECRDTIIHSATRLTCVAPPYTEPGSVRLSLSWSDGHQESYNDALAYYVPLLLDAVDPNRLSASTGGETLLSGQGFVEDMYAVVNGDRVPTTFLSETEATILVPRLRSGVYDVSLHTPNQRVVAEAVLTLFAPLEINGISPAVSTILGSEMARITGVGFQPNTEVLFGANEAMVQSIRDDGTGISVIVPQAASPGFVDLTVSNGNGTATLNDEFLYTSNGGDTFHVDGLLPRRVPSAASAGFWIGGQGFDITTQVFLDEQRLNTCVVVSENRMDCPLGVRTAGRYEVMVRNSQGLEFGPFDLEVYAEPLFFSIEPTRGSVAGGTLVTIYGEGFDPTVRLKFFEQPLEILSVHTDRVVALTPPSAEGAVDLQIEQGDARVYSPQAYEYLNLGTSYGGVFGPTVERNLNVSVYDARTNRPIAGAIVQVESVLTAATWITRTNTSGQVVVADPELSGPLVVTAGHDEYTSATIDRVVSQNVSLLLISKVPPEGRGTPEAAPLVTIAGQLLGMDALEKPEEGGRILMAVVETSHPYPNGLFSLPTPTETSILFEDGPFELLALPGQFGVIVTVGLISVESLMAYQAGELNYWVLRREIEPRAMGYAPFLTGHPGDRVTDIDVVVDRPRRLMSTVSLDNPPGGVANGPNQYLARAILELGADGYFDLGVEQRSDVPELAVSGLPQIEEWPESHVRLRWEGEAYVEPGEMPTVSRYSWSTVTTDEVRETQSIGPFLPTTEVVSPEFDAITESPSMVRWVVHPGLEPEVVQEVADLHYLNLSNQDGSLWTGWIPGAVDSVELPLGRSPLQGQLADVNLYYLSIFSALATPQFSFDDFSFGSLGNLRAYSWSFTRFSDGELPQVEVESP